jgi:glutamyl-tRNA synthetase
MRFPVPHISISGCVFRPCKAQLGGRYASSSNTAVRPGPNLPRAASSTTQARRLLPTHPARTRFAPSPTGSLHLGSIRTALFNYLLAKRTGGQFLLRIEDTDKKRTIPGAEEQLYKDLGWCGLRWDEGPVVGGPHGPYRQSERNKIYIHHVNRLLDSNHAYRCFCSAERLDTLNQSRHQKGLQLGYDRKCSSIPVDESNDRERRGEAHVVRLRSPGKYPPWHDFVYGKTGKTGKEGRKNLIDDAVYDDPIMMKSDSHPTYHLANVVDDHLMKITHVIRGSEWMSSTPMHLALYEAFGWQPPEFGHVPLLVDQNGQKLSKRNLDTDISSFRDKEGIFPDALVNFAVLLGWSHLQKSDLLPLRQLEKVFDLKLTKGNTMVSFAKLQFLQNRYARQYIAEGGEHFQNIVEQVSTALRDIFNDKHISAVIGGRTLQDIVQLMLLAHGKSYTTAAAFARQNFSFFNLPPEPWLYENLGSNYPQPAVRVAASSLQLVPEHLWTAAVLRDNIAAIKPPNSDFGAESDDTFDKTKAWRAEVCHFLRYSLTGSSSGPPIADLMEIMGRDICVERIKRGIEKIHQQEQAASFE